MMRWCWAVAMALTLPAAAQPLAAFFQQPALSDVALAPSGNYLAAKVVDARGRTVLAVIDAASRAVTIAAASRRDDIHQFQWVNDTRLVYTLKGPDAGDDAVEGPGLFAVDRDGTAPLQLAERDPLPGIEPTHIRKHILPWSTALMAPGAQDSPFIYVTSNEYDDGGRGRHVASVNLLRLDTLTGVAHAVAKPGPAQHWWLDFAGQPRLVLTRTRAVDTMHYRDPATGNWRALASFDGVLGGQGVLNPVGFGPDGALYVTRTLQGPTASMVRFDVAAGKADTAALVTAPGYDVDAKLVRDNARVLGATLTTDTRTQVWFDAGMQAVQAAVDQALPDTVNLITVAAQATASNVLVESFSDQVPPRYALFNRQTKLLSTVGSAYPQIVPEQMGHQRMMHYPARDGLVIPALLTLPPGGTGQHLPMVVLVHGGPWQRGPTWEWNAQSQFLASRGYAVLEPHFRGSTGLGYRHFAAGFRQWGLAMQDDLADGVRWAIAQGYADASRICIAGASYGGYAVLMGLIRDPGLYRCGVAWTGVTDLALLYTGSWQTDSDITDDQRAYGMPRMIGDPVTDAAQLEATSPIAQASRITQPLLLAYGGADRRVPMAQGKLFYEQVTKTNPRVAWIAYGNEGHGWYLQPNRIDFWSKVEKFLAATIGKP
jgi:dipeptidyl aminopeptidase/acylaminoacyl peptidase